MVPRDHRRSYPIARVRRVPGVRLSHDTAGHRHVGELPGMPHGAVPTDQSPSLVTGVATDRLETW